MSSWRDVHSTPSSVGGNRGLSRLLRDIKRQEADARDLLTVHESRKAHRLGRCCTKQAEPSQKGSRRRKAA